MLLLITRREASSSRPNTILQCTKFNTAIHGSIRDFSMTKSQTLSSSSYIHRHPHIPIYSSCAGPPPPVVLCGRRHNVVDRGLTHCCLLMRRRSSPFPSSSHIIDDYSDQVEVVGVYVIGVDDAATTNTTTIRRSFAREKQQQTHRESAASGDQ